MPNKRHKGTNKKVKRKPAAVPRIVPPVVAVHNEKDVVHFVIPDELFQFELGEQKGRLIIKNLAIKTKICFSYPTAESCYKFLFFLFFGDEPFDLPSSSSCLLRLFNLDDIVKLINDCSNQMLGFNAIVRIPSSNLLTINKKICGVGDRTLKENASFLFASFFSMAYHENFITNQLKMLDDTLSPLLDTLKKQVFITSNFFLRDIFFKNKEQRGYAIQLFGDVLFSPPEAINLTDDRALFIVKMIRAEKKALSVELINHNDPNVQQSFLNNADSVRNIIKDFVLAIAGEVDFNTGRLSALANQVMMEKISKLRLLSQMNNLIYIRPYQFGLAVLTSENLVSLHVAEQGASACFWQLQSQYFHYFKKGVMLQQLEDFEALIRRQDELSYILSQYLKVLQEIFHEMTEYAENFFNENNFSSAYSFFEFPMPLDIVTDEGKSLFKDMMRESYPHIVTLKQIMEVQFFTLPSILQKYNRSVSELNNKVKMFSRRVEAQQQITTIEPVAVKSSMNNNQIVFSDIPLRLEQLTQTSNNDNIYFYIPISIRNECSQYCDLSSIKITSQRWGDFGWKYLGHIADATLSWNGGSSICPICYELKINGTTDRVLGALIAADKPYQNTLLIVAVSVIKGGLHTAAQKKSVKKSQHRVQIP